MKMPMFPKVFKVERHKAEITILGLTYSANGETPLGAMSELVMALAKEIERKNRQEQDHIKLPLTEFKRERVKTKLKEFPDFVWNSYNDRELHTEEWSEIIAAIEEGLKGDD